MINSQERSKCVLRGQKKETRSWIRAVVKMCRTAEWLGAGYSRDDCQFLFLVLPLTSCVNFGNFLKTLASMSSAVKMVKTTLSTSRGCCEDQIC